jgi:Uma2 family endonuclease
MMSEPACRRMTADEFIAWAMTLPDGEHYELVGGELIAMSPERVAHSRMKLRATNLLAAAIARAGVPCEALIDGPVVAVDADTVYEPDTLVRCGAPLPGDTVRIDDPLVVVEVVSPSSRARDAGAKLVDYFRIPSLMHYLIVDTRSRAVIHHRRDAGQSVATRIVRAGALTLDPPGLTVTVEELFG